ncbi:DUF3048 domain-containing protein [Xylanimonas protaetiae]|uniref:DUF3048 domain-containing protein n=1 Tax=Xylanimonas protaetiae TaxID=2509457 RepID=A0A4P6F595_9MICO|nr:DUF3048 domain-containing protein [Xylanimonas protaetiae]QAY69923.1 DUF3048 domain-containing protein [Xylanimonas protaetiae]
MTRRPLAALSGVLALALTLSACSADEPAAVTVTATPSPDATRVAPPEPVVPAEPVVWPLTGVETAEVAQRPALAVKVENAREARPLTGLEKADTVWEQTVEGGITRFVAVYQSQLPDTVEPVRSVRPMDAGIVAPLGGLLAFSGGQARFVNEVRDAGVQIVSMDAGNGGFSRDRSRRAPHNVVGNIQTFLGQARDDRKVPPPAQFAFAKPGEPSSAETAGTPASLLDITFSRMQRTKWSWDAASGTWQRSDGDTPSVSSAGVRLAATNVVALTVNQVDTGTVDPSGTAVLETKMVDSGEGFVASAGKTVPVHWSKPAVDAPLLLTAADGSPITLQPGNTWVQLVPKSTGTWTVAP